MSYYNRLFDLFHFLLIIFHQIFIILTHSSTITKTTHLICLKAIGIVLSTVQVIPFVSIFEAVFSSYVGKVSFSTPAFIYQKVLYLKQAYYPKDLCNFLTKDSVIFINVFRNSFFYFTFTRILLATSSHSVEHVIRSISNTAMTPESRSRIVASSSSFLISTPTTYSTLGP